MFAIQPLHYPGVSICQIIYHVFVARSANMRATSTRQLRYSTELLFKELNPTYLADGTKKLPFGLEAPVNSPAGVNSALPLISKEP